jgi:hypothetical protein
MDHTTYKILSDYLSKGIYPDNLDKTEKRSIRSQANPFRMKDLLMYHSSKDQLRRVVVAEDKQKVLQSVHAEKGGGGHFGMDQTIKKISDR